MLNELFSRLLAGLSLGECLLSRETLVHQQFDIELSVSFIHPNDLGLGG